MRGPIFYKLFSFYWASSPLYLLQKLSHLILHLILNFFFVAFPVLFRSNNIYPAEFLKTYRKIPKS